MNASSYQLPWKGKKKSQAKEKEEDLVEQSKVIDERPFRGLYILDEYIKTLSFKFCLSYFPYAVV